MSMPDGHDGLRGIESEPAWPSEDGSDQLPAPHPNMVRQALPHSGADSLLNAGASP